MGETVQERLGGTLGLGAVHYQGGRDELNRKCRERDDEIDRLRNLLDAKDQEIAELKAALEGARERAIISLIAIVEGYEVPYVPPHDLAYGKGFIEGQNATVVEIVKSFRALLSGGAK